MLAACCVYVVERVVSQRPGMVCWRALPADEQLRFLLFTLRVRQWIQEREMS